MTKENGVSSAKPLIRWAGSKRKLLPELSNYWNQKYVKYIEPFAGSAVLFFALSPKHACLNDLNSDLVDMYRTVRKYPEKVYRRYRSIPVSKEHYVSLRPVAFEAKNPVHRAANFLYLNRNCFNGILSHQ